MKRKKSLAFLFSQPRSGSTLTQKMLGAHPEVYTRSEPWIMLPAAYTLNFHADAADYNSWLAYRARKNFIADLREGEETYLAALRSMHESLYDDYLDRHGKSLFLDKTPRYYLVADELHRIFPEAKMVLLLRNPLSVLRSIIKSWTKEAHEKLAEYRVDLEKGIEVFDALLTRQPAWLYVCRYEALLADPEQELVSLCNYLGITYDPGMLEYYRQPQERWEFGDPENVYAKAGVDAGNQDMAWLEQVEDPRLWRLYYDYLTFLGAERYARMGYDYAVDMRRLNDNIPSDSKEGLLQQTTSLHAYLHPDNTALTEENTRLSQMLKGMRAKVQELNIQNKMLSQSAEALYKELDNIKRSKRYRFALQLSRLKQILKR